MTIAELSPAFWERAERLTELRRTEQKQMQEYVGLKSGHMAFLIRALDGDPTGIVPSVLSPLPTTASPMLIQEAIAFLKRSGLSIEPRKKWPDGGGLPIYQIKGNIAAHHQAQQGKALSVWGDAGWGQLVKKGKYTDNYFADELVRACVAMIHEWNPTPAPTWVTCIPSLRHPDLVPNFAGRLAQALNLPFHAVLNKTDARPEQKRMANSAQQARNLDDSLCVSSLPPPEGPVLLVDDMVDSRWTLTVATWLLRKHGSGEVWPIALAHTGNEQ